MRKKRMFYTTRRAGLAQRKSSSELLCSHEERETFREELLRLLDMEEYPEEGRPPSPPPRDFFRL